MLTIDTLRQFGANTEEGLRRCMGSEALYLRLVVMALEDPGFERLTAAVEADDRRSAFQAVHAIKGVMANLALTPLFEA